MKSVRLRKKNQVTLPEEACKNIRVQVDDQLTVLTWNDNAMILVPQKLKTPGLLAQSALLAQKRGISMEELLLELDEIRHNA